MRFNEWAKEYERREGKNVEYPYSNSGIKNRLNVRLDAIFNDIKTYEWNHVDNEEKCDSMIETEELPEYKVSIVDGKKFYTEIVTSNQEVESKEKVNYLNVIHCTQRELYNEEITFFELILEILPAKVKGDNDILADIKKGNWLRISVKDRARFAKALLAVRRNIYWKSLQVDLEYLYYMLVGPREYRIKRMCDYIFNNMAEIEVNDAEYIEALEKVDKYVSALYEIVRTQEGASKLYEKVEECLIEKLDKRIE